MRCLPTLVSIVIKRYLYIQEPFDAALCPELFFVFIRFYYATNLRYSISDSEMP